MRVEDVPDKGLPRGRADQVPVGIVGVVDPAGAGEAVVGVVGVVRGSARRGLGEQVADRVIRPGPRPVAGRVGGADQAVEGIVAESGRARRIGLGEAVAVGVLGVVHSAWGSCGGWHRSSSRWSHWWEVSEIRERVASSLDQVGSVSA